MWVSASMATSAKMAPHDREEKLSRSLGISEVAVPSSEVLPLRAMRVEMDSDFSGLDLRQSLPSLVSMSSGAAPWRGDWVSAMASCASLSLACMAASYTPGQTEAAVVDPPEPPDTG